MRSQDVAALLSVFLLTIAAVAMTAIIQAAETDRLRVKFGYEQAAVPAVQTTRLLWRPIQRATPLGLAP